MSGLETRAKEKQTDFQLSVSKKQPLILWVLLNAWFGKIQDDQEFCHFLAKPDYANLCQHGLSGDKNEKIGSISIFSKVPRVLQWLVIIPDYENINFDSQGYQRYM